MTPLSLVFANGKSSGPCEQIVEEKLGEIISAMDSAAKGVLKLDEFHNEMRFRANYLPDSEIKECMKYVRKVARAKAKFMKNMRDLVRTYRRDPDNELYDHMDDEIEHLMKVCSIDSVEKHIATTWHDRMEYANFLSEKAYKGVDIVSDSSIENQDGVARCIQLG